jgi:hypothetical protein
MIQGYPKPYLMETFKYYHTFAEWGNKLGEKKRKKKLTQRYIKPIYLHNIETYLIFLSFDFTHLFENNYIICGTFENIWDDLRIKLCQTYIFKFF